MRRIDGLGITAEVLENPFNDCWCLNAGDDTQGPTALPAGLIGHIPVPDRCAATFGYANRQPCRFVDIKKTGSLITGSQRISDQRK
jgi:hypothetical protein